MGTVDRALGVLRLFSEERPAWTVEAVAAELKLSQSTAYQYVRSFVDVGLLSTYKTGLYVIGPAIIELDRQTRRRDPLVLAARDEMDALSALLPGDDDVVLLCRLYKFTVMCVDQRAPTAPRKVVSYERGRPMPLNRGSASKVILAYLPPRVLRRYFDQNISDGTDEGWAAFRRPLRAIRRAELCVAHGELDPGRIGLSAPIFTDDGDIVGSIGLVLTESATGDGSLDQELQKRVIRAGHEVTARMHATK